MPAISWVAVAVCTVVAFVLGGLWYGPLFSKPWMAEHNIDKDTFKPRYSKGVMFSITILLNFIAAVVFSAFLGPAPAMGLAIGAGVSTGLCWVAPALAICHMFSSRSVKLILIDAGFPVAMFTAYGVIFAYLG